MIQKCFYPECGIIYGEKEPLSDKSTTHGLCPKHFEISLQELKAEVEKLSAKMGTLKILIVEDSHLYRQLLKETLHDQFPTVEIEEAADGEEALRKTEVLLPNLIFMDIKLPGESGLELTRRIKTRHPQIVVVILTAYDAPEYREGSKAYADYFFSKGTSSADTILSLVKSILDRA